MGDGLPPKRRSKLMKARILVVEHNAEESGGAGKRGIRVYIQSKDDRPFIYIGEYLVTDSVDDFYFRKTSELMMAPKVLSLMVYQLQENLESMIMQLSEGRVSEEEDEQHLLLTRSQYAIFKLGLLQECMEKGEWEVEREDEYVPEMPSFR
jgi:hypothetical protein